MEYSCQFDPLDPNEPMELTCDGVVIATTTLKNAQELSAKLNSQAELYEAGKQALAILNVWLLSPSRDVNSIKAAVMKPLEQALAKAGGKS